jgi:hypothetical protein
MSFAEKIGAALTGGGSSPVQGDRGGECTTIPTNGSDTLARMADINSLSIAETAAVSASAAVTALMAFYTRSLARKTADVAEWAQKEAEAVVQQGQAISSQAKASREQAELTRRTLQAARQPWLVVGNPKEAAEGADPFRIAQSGFAGPLTIDRSTTNLLSVSLLLRNIGTGLTLIDTGASPFVGWSSPGQGAQEEKPFNSATTDSPVVRPGEFTILKWRMDLQALLTTFEEITHQLRNDGEFALDVIYSDTAGEQITRVRCKVARTPPNQWAVYELDYHAPPDSALSLTVRIS